MEIAKKLEQKIYKIGYFFQLTCDNPLFLDLTGKLIKDTSMLLEEWNGDANGFNFRLKNSNIKGKVNMANIWFGDDKNEWMIDSHLNEYIANIKNILDKIISIQKPENYKRLGFRVQFIYNKADYEMLDKFNSMYKKQLKAYEDYSIKTTSIGYELEKSNIKSKILISYAVKNEDVIDEAPQNGFLIDCDTYVDSKDTRIEDCIEEYFKYLDTDIGRISDSIRYMLGVKNA